MVFIITALIGAILAGLAVLFNDILVENLYTVVFDCGQYLMTATGVEYFAAIEPTIYGIGTALIILKFLKKAFEIYVLWTDGDPDADPVLLLTNFIRAIAMALGFKWIYQIFVDVCREVSDSILHTIDVNSDFTQELINGFTSGGIVFAAAGLMFFICFLILYFSLMMRGIEMLVMNAGIPLACTGLIDNDKGVFRAYVNQYVKAFITTIVQITLCKIGLTLVLGSTVLTWTNIFWGIACMISAISIPKTLREFLLPAGGGSVGNTMFQSVRVISMAQGLFK